MGLSYDPGSRKWNLVYEKVDYETDKPTNLPETKIIQEVVPYTTFGYDPAYGTTVPITNYTTVNKTVPNQNNIETNKRNKELNALKVKLN